MLPRTGIAFFLGILLVQQLPELPSPEWLWVALPLATVLWWRPRYWYVPCGFAAGLLWALCFAHLRLAQALPPELIGHNLDVQGYIVSIPDVREDSVRFEFEIVRQVDDARMRLPVPFRVRLNWYAYGKQPLPEVKAGDFRHFTIRLKPPNGFFNPGGFDYEGWLFSHGIRATGYVRRALPESRTGTDEALFEPPLRFQLAWWRNRLFEHIRRAMPESHNRGVMAGLALGYRAEIPKAQWRLLLETGTNHLVAISGLHIGLIAGLFYAVVLRLGGWLPAGASVWPRQRVAALSAYAAAVVYAMLAGLALPTQRALIMLGVGLTGILAYRQIRPGHALLLALVVVLLFDPFAVLSPGFWLSFGAVAVLVYIAAGRGLAGPQSGGPTDAVLRRGWLWGKLQGLLLLGILPLSVIWFGRVAIGGILANLIAIPWVGMVIVPLVLLATAVSLVSLPLAEWLFLIADRLLEVFWQWLELVGSLPFNLWAPPAPSLWVLVCAFAGVALLLAPRGLPGRWVGILWLLPLMLATPPVPRDGEFWLTALDVGQGTAVVVRTREHTLVYDAGPKFSDRFNTGEAVVLPYLQSLGVNRIDRLLISHGDNDHIGGAQVLIDMMPVGSILTSVPERFNFEPYSGAPGGSAPVDRCLTGQQWQWDGVTFEILHPTRPGEGNNASCVLQVTAQGGRVLLSGDIEKQAERQLLLDNRLQPVELLVVPHHGSRTSSTAAFIDALRPAHAVFTSGYLNRYGFPKPDVVARYKERKTAIWITGEEGAMVFEVNDEGASPRLLYRQESGKYWHRKPP